MTTYVFVVLLTCSFIIFKVVDVVFLFFGLCVCFSLVLRDVHPQKEEV